MNNGVPNDATLATVLIFGLFAAILAVIAEKTHFFPRAVRWIQKDPVVRTALVVLLFAIGPITARTKNGQMSLSRPPLLLQVVELPPESAIAPVSVWTNGVALRAESTNAVEITAFRTVGGSELGDWIETAAPFFAVGTNPVNRCFVSASGSVSFDSMRRPPVGVALPDETGLPVLCPLRAHLGFVPEANWHLLQTGNGQPETGNGGGCRFWHDSLPGGGRVLTWENALVDRLPSRRVSLQVEMRPTGDSVFRYSFQDELDPSPTNFVMGAQMGTNGVNALSILGTNTLAATVWNVDGAPVTNGVSIADLLCTNGALHTPATFEIRWKNTTGLGPDADTDDDGLTDWAETFVWGTAPDHADTDGDGTADNVELMMGADPFDADEDGNGVPDGMDEEEWLANSLWASNAGETNVVISLLSAIPADGVATLVVGDLSLPLRNPTDIPIFLPPGEYVPFRLVSHDAGNVALSLDEAAPVPMRGHVPDIERPTGPLWVDDPSGVFGGLTPSGSGAMAVPTLHLKDADGNEDEASVCVHDDSPVSWTFSVDPAAIGLTLNDVHVEDFLVDDDNTVSLSVDGEYPCEATGTIALAPPKLFRGIASVSRSIHRCVGLHLSRCEICDMDHDSGEPDHCPHAEDCPTRTNAVSNCTCPTPVIRVQGTGTDLSEYAQLHFPVAGQCCCSPDLTPLYARIKQIDPNLHVTNSLGTVTAPSNISGSAVVYASTVSGSRPSEIEYEIVHRHYDAGGAVTNEVTRTSKMPVWAVNILHEPVTTATQGGATVNPSGIVRGQTGFFKIEITPAAFPSNLVCWSASPANRVSFPSGTNGVEMVVRGETLGDVTLTASIVGYKGPPIVCNARVVDETVVPVHAFIICDTNGVAATSQSNIQAMLNGVNGIYAQVGRRFDLASCSSITNQNWTNVTRDSTGNWTEFYNIVSYTNGTGGIEMYFNQSIQDAVGLTIPAGILIATNGIARTVAHELGHAQGLPDIYDSWPTTPLVVTGLVSKARIPDDWGSSSEEGYYPKNLMQSTLIQRLVMYGYDLPTACDFPTGDVFGLWYPPFTSNPFQVTNCPVGFFTNASTNPTSN